MAEQLIPPSYLINRQTFDYQNSGMAMPADIVLESLKLINAGGNHDPLSRAFIELLGNYARTCSDKGEPITFSLNTAAVLVAMVDTAQGRSVVNNQAA